MVKRFGNHYKAEGGTTVDEHLLLVVLLDEHSREVRDEEEGDGQGCHGLHYAKGNDQHLFQTGIHACRQLERRNEHRGDEEQPSDNLKVPIAQRPPIRYVIFKRVLVPCNFCYVS